MKKLFVFLASMTLALGLSGCSMDKQDTSTLAGAAVGGLVGSQFGHGGGAVAATVGGAALGGLAGHHLGKDDKDD